MNWKLLGQRIELNNFLSGKLGYWCDGNALKNHYIGSGKSFVYLLMEFSFCFHSENERLKSSHLIFCVLLFVVILFRIVFDYKRNLLSDWLFSRSKKKDTTKTLVEDNDKRKRWKKTYHSVFCITYIRYYPHIEHHILYGSSLW